VRQAAASVILAVLQAVRPRQLGQQADTFKIVGNAKINSRMRL